MIVRAINTIYDAPSGTMRPGDVFTISDDEAKRLLNLGAVEPVRKMINLQVDVSGKDDADTKEPIGEE